MCESMRRLGWPLVRGSISELVLGKDRTQSVVAIESFLHLTVCLGQRKSFGVPRENHDRGDRGINIVPSCAYVDVDKPQCQEIQQSIEDVVSVVPCDFPRTVPRLPFPCVNN